jgi:putative transposase
MATTARQFASWTFTQGARKPGSCHRWAALVTPTTTPIVESFWGRLQSELLNRQRWNTLVELANAIFEYIEAFHNRRRRHFALSWQASIDFENATLKRAPAPQNRVRQPGR